MINVTNNHSPPYTNTYTPLINSHHTPGSLPCHDELPPHPTRTHSSPPPLQTSSFSHCLHTRSSALEPNFGMGARPTLTPRPPRCRRAASRTACTRAHRRWSRTLGWARAAASSLSRHSGRSGGSGACARCSTASAP